MLAIAFIDNGEYFDMTTSSIKKREVTSVSFLDIL